MRGTGPQPIRFSSTLACGDMIGSRSCEAIPGRIWLFGGIAVSDSGTGDFEYCTMEHAFNGLSLGGPTQSVSGCRLADCQYGIVHRSDSTCNRTIKNCLFRGTWSSAIDATTTWPLWVFNSTFYRGQIGVECTTGTSVTIRNSIFDDNTTGIYKKASLSVTESYNCFWLNAANANFSPLGQGDLTQDPKFVNTTAADLYERFYLNQGPTTSPCVIYGNPNDTRFLTTALDKDLDTSPVDIGYHYPVRGHLHVAPNYFFEFEDGEAFYPIAAVNEPGAVTSASVRQDFRTITLPNYLATVSRHGVNAMRVAPFATTRQLQDKELNPTSGTGYFREDAVKDYSAYFDALESAGLCYWVQCYEYLSLTKDPYESTAESCIYWKWRGGTVPDELIGHFFREDETITTGRKARQHFKLALNQFLDNRHQTPKWYTRAGLVGWDLFGQIDGQERRPEWLTTETLAVREDIVNSWVVDMTTYMDTTESLRLGSRRLQWVDVYNLRRLKQQGWDPGGDGPSYVDLVTNRFIDYNLYTKYSWDRNQMWTEYPVEPFTPLKHYLGAAGDLGDVHCTLPEVIDFYRNPGGGGSRRGGFFSTQFFLRGYQALFGDNIDLNPTPVPRKRQLSDIYHNYIWLTFATGSVGGPVPGAIPAGAGPAAAPYDLSGVTYLSPMGVILNTYTDEILDSMLSLNRLTSLMRWKWVGDSYRPMRMTRLSSGPRLELRSTTSGLELPENAWLWTGASDATFTVGWIVHNYAHNYNVPESVDGTTPVLCPKVHIFGLTQGVPLELAWFDDHKGQLIGNRSVTTIGQFTSVTVPATVPGGFWKSVAFVIQPAGLTPNQYFEPLSSYPNHLIGQIEASPRGSHPWYEESQETSSRTVTLTARTKPAIGSLQNWRFDWRFESETSNPTSVYGQNSIVHTYSDNNNHLVKVDIYDPQGHRVSGDITDVKTNPQ